MRGMRELKPDPVFTDRLMKRFEERSQAGGFVEAAVREPLPIVFSSPGFLHLAEPVPEQERRLFSGRELATRLAYFLWSAPPHKPPMPLVRAGGLGVSDQEMG